MTKKKAIIIFASVLGILTLIISTIVFVSMRNQTDPTGNQIGSNEFDVSNDVFTLENGYLRFNDVPPIPGQDGFVFNNDHIILEEYDMTQSEFYQRAYEEDDPEWLEMLDERIELSREVSNATVEDLERALQQYEFYVRKIREDAILYMKSFNGIPTNDWYRRSYGYYFKSYETITSEMAWEFLQDPRNDPRNFEGEIPLPNMGDYTLYLIHIQPMIVLRDGQLYSIIFVHIYFYDADDRLQFVGRNINAATGGVYEWDTFPNAPTFP